MRRKNLSQCYLCGKVNERSKFTLEHVPPKFLSPRSPDTEFAKVAACKNCNSKYSHEESKFRDFLAVATAGKGIKSADDAYSSARRNFLRNPIARLFIGPSKDLKRIVRSIKREDIYSPSGKIYLGQALVIRMPDDVGWRDIVLKIAKGLHFLKSGYVVPENYKTVAKFIREVEFPELYKRCKVRGHAGDFFHFAGGWVKEDPKSGLWYMVFYKTVGFMVWFLKSKTVSKSGKKKIE